MQCLSVIASACNSLLHCDAVKYYTSLIIANSNSETIQCAVKNVNDNTGITVSNGNRNMIVSCNLIRSNKKQSVSISSSLYNDSMYCVAKKSGKALSVTSHIPNQSLECVGLLYGKNVTTIGRAIGEDMKIRCNLICSLGKSEYLNVRPNTLWLSREALSSMDFEVLSNVKWDIN